MITLFENFRSRSFDNNVKLNFVVGGYVYCINVGDSRVLKMDTLYKIREITSVKDDFYVYLEGFPTDYNWYASKFRKATEIEIDSNKYNL